MSDTCYVDSKTRSHRLVWQMVLKADDCGDKPDERDDGFWPSRDRNAAGYVEPSRFAEAQTAAKERMAAWKRGDWGYIGVVARATLYVAASPESSTHVVMSLDSPGVWGIESDAGDYLTETFNVERETLRDLLESFGAALAAGAVAETVNGRTVYE